MRHYTLQDTEPSPVSHDPSLMKKVLIGEGVLPGIKGLSHIVFAPGTVVQEHVHKDGSEVFYCIRGSVRVRVSGTPLTLGPGHCLIIEPGDPHAFDIVTEETELLYFFLTGGHGPLLLGVMDPS